jgi:outer membrane immunogenic protein
MKKAVLPAIALAAFVSGAQAADLGVPRGPVSAAVVAPVFGWTGFYLGAQIGHQWGQVNGNICASGGVVFCNPFVTSPNGIVGGVHVGYNWQFNSLVAGLEADLEANGARGTTVVAGFGGPYYQRSRGNWQGSVRARLGFAADRALFYVTGGLAVSDYSYAIGFTPTTSAPFHRYGATRAGWTVGAGVEYAFAPNWTGRVEYRYADFGTVTNDDPVANSYGRHRLTTHTVRVGVSYLFSTGPAAVVARY